MDIVDQNDLMLRNEQIASKIIVFRGVQTLLDRDLAEMYGVETKRLKEQVNRNAERFPDSFMFRLSNEEFKVLRSQFVTSKQETRISELDVDKFNEQYPILIVKRTKSMHDRFLIIDNKDLYHIGASLKDLGKACFAFEKMEDSRKMIPILLENCT